MLLWTETPACDMGAMPILNPHCVAADSVESRLRDLMLAVHEHGHGTEDELTSAVQCRQNCQSEEAALNETVVKLFNQCDIATLIGNVDDMEAELEEDTDEEDEGEGEQR
jgi:hypothetical protein